MTAFEPDALLDAARAATGLDDFGPHAFRPGLDALCASLAADAQLNDLGSVAIPGMLVGSLSNRLRIYDWVTTHPEVREETIAAPIVVIGMFRAGTTLLSRLFDQDARNRALLMWEAGDSVPPPTPGNHRGGPRVDAVHANNAMLAEINPQIEVVHHEQADEATECITLMAQDFKSLTYEAIANVLRTSTTGSRSKCCRAVVCAAGGRSRAPTTRSRSSTSPPSTRTPGSCCSTAIRSCSLRRCAV
jgi:hypothetical protein